MLYWWTCTIVGGEWMSVSMRPCLPMLLKANYQTCVQSNERRDQQLICLAECGDSERGVWVGTGGSSDAKKQWVSSPQPSLISTSEFHCSLLAGRSIALSQRWAHQWIANSVEFSQAQLNHCSRPFSRDSHDHWMVSTWWRLNSESMPKQSRTISCHLSTMFERRLNCFLIVIKIRALSVSGWTDRWARVLIRVQCILCM